MRQIMISTITFVQKRRFKTGMQIQIIGLGVVGKAQAYLMNKLGHKVTGYDVQPVSSPYIRDVKVTDRPVSGADLTFICAPEKVVPSILKNLVEGEVHNPYVIKSTVPPGTTQALMQEYGVHICHNPEFLREEIAFDDVINQKFVIIGECCPEHGDLLADVYAPLDSVIIRTKPTISEMSKLVLNNYLSTLITFWNEVDKLCATLKIDTKDVAELIKNDTRISEYGTAFFGQPFGGKCLPKDLNQLLTLCHSRGLHLKLFEAIKDINMELSVKSALNPVLRSS
jgi:nucleotide sugar dehydrogenase